jgi:hypothetical protein
MRLSEKRDLSSYNKFKRNYCNKLFEVKEFVDYYNNEDCEKDGTFRQGEMIFILRLEDFEACDWICLEVLTKNGIFHIFEYIFNPKLDTWESRKTFMKKNFRMV